MRRSLLATGRGTRQTFGRSAWVSKRWAASGEAFPGGVCMEALALVLALFFGPPAVRAGDAAAGYRLLTEKAYLPPDFDQETIERVWEVWPPELREQAARLSKDERWKMILDRYGLTPRPDDPTKVLQYVIDSDGNWTMNCLACHGGRVAGRVIPGLPNSNFALELLTVETRQIKWKLDKPLARMDLGILLMPLGRSRGTTNAVMFGVSLMAYRDAQLNVYPTRTLPPMQHHDMDAPPWWHYRKKDRLYIDGSVHKWPRAIMQFMLVQENGPERFREWEAEFEDVHAYLESLEPPPYPFAIDQELANTGREVFELHCAECHGTYGPGGSYPERRVPIGDVGTDPVRLQALGRKDRLRYQASWFNGFGKYPVEEQPDGYVAPPMDGIWATAPYFHNGSVPTLWHVLHPESRPVVWRRKDPAGYAYDAERVGLDVQCYDAPTNELAAHVDPQWDERELFDTTQHGKSNAGHDYPSQLDPEQKRAVLEYLKTL